MTRSAPARFSRPVKKQFRCHRPALGHWWRLFSLCFGQTRSGRNLPRLRLTRQAAPVRWPRFPSHICVGWFPGRPKNASAGGLRRTPCRPSSSVLRQSPPVVARTRPCAIPCGLASRRSCLCSVRGWPAKSSLPLFRLECASLRGLSRGFPTRMTLFTDFLTSYSFR